VALVNALLVRWAGGYHEVTDAASIAQHKRKEGFLQLGAVQSVEQVETICEALFAYMAQVQVATTMAVHPTGSGDVPGQDWDEGDWITAPAAEGGTASQRVLALTTSADEEGNPVFVPELRGVREQESDEINRWLKRLANGALGGVTNTASPATSSRGSGQFTPMVWGQFPPFSYPGPLAADTSGIVYPISSTRIVRWQASMRVSGTSETTVRLLVDGATVDTITFGGNGTGQSDFAYSSVAVDVTTGSAVQVQLVTPGTDAEDLVVQLLTGS